uniref:Integrase catalytic domain-containing protein n=1 Tax=Peronospora matthiolae TaxID=2874970 RepID=A0AAV1U7M8_9STRA
MVQTQFCKKVKFVRHDGAREFATNSLQLFYEDEGIEQQTTVPYAHQNNGTAIAPSGLSSRSAVACFIMPNWTSVSGPKQR